LGSLKGRYKCLGWIGELKRNSTSSKKGIKQKKTQAQVGAHTAWALRGSFTKGPQRGGRWLDQTDGRPVPPAISAEEKSREARLPVKNSKSKVTEKRKAIGTGVKKMRGTADQKDQREEEQRITSPRVEPNVLGGGSS